MLRGPMAHRPSPHARTSRTSRTSRVEPSRGALVVATLLGGLLTGLLLPSAAAAGGWTQAQDAYYLKLWGRAISGDGAYDVDGEVVAIERFYDLQLNVYGEYGVTDDWTALFFGVPTGYANALTDTLYLGPLGVGVRRALLSRDLKLAAELRYGFESGVGGEDVLSRPGEPRGQVVYVPAIDNHRGELELQAGHGLSFGWVVASAGMRLNSEDGVDHAVIGGVQLGFQLGRFQLELHLQTYQPLGDVRVTNASGVGQTRYVGGGLGVGYRFGESVGAVAGLDGGAARSNAVSASYLAGLELF